MTHRTYWMSVLADMAELFQWFSCKSTKGNIHSMEVQVQVTKVHETLIVELCTYLLHSSTTKRIHSLVKAVCGLWAVELPTRAGCYSEGECILGAFVPELSWNWGAWAGGAADWAWAEDKGMGVSGTSSWVCGINWEGDWAWEEDGRIGVNSTLSQVGRINWSGGWALEEDRVDGMPGWAAGFNWAGHWACEKDEGMGVDNMIDCSVGVVWVGCMLDWLVSIGCISKWSVGVIWMVGFHRLYTQQVSGGFLTSLSRVYSQLVGFHRLYAQ